MNQHTSALRELRETITKELLLYEIETRLKAEGRSMDECEAWTPCLFQSRISSAETNEEETSDGPMRQLLGQADYAVCYRLYPAAFCFEAQSGHLSDLKPRKLFRRYFEEIRDDELRIEAIVTHAIDRFTRDRYIGEEWFKLLKHKGIDLHESEFVDVAPKPFAQCEDTYAGKVHAAWRESQNTSKRSINKKRYLASLKKFVGGIANAYGHEVIKDENDKTIGGAIVPHEVEVIREIVDRVLAGETLYAVLADLNQRGLRTRNGSTFQRTAIKKMLLSWRLCGYMQVQGEEYAVDGLEPIITVAEHALLEEALAVKHPRRQAAAGYLLSGLGRCGSCGAPLVGSGAQGQKSYRCSKPHLRGQKLCRCDRPDDRCVCARNNTAADGVRHTSRRVAVLDRFLLEIALAVMNSRAALEDANEVATQGEGPTRAQDLEAEQRKLRKDREWIIDQVGEGYTREKADAKTKPINERLTEIDEQLRVEHKRAHRVKREEVIDYAEMREAAFKKPAYARSLIETVIDGFTIHAPRSTMTPYDGVTIEFAEGVPAQNELCQQMVAELSLEFMAQHRLTRRRTHDDTERRIFELYREGRTGREIALRLNEVGMQTVSGKDWTTACVHRVAERACQRRNVPYIKPDTYPSIYDQDTRDTIVMLKDGGTSWNALPAELADLGVQHPKGRDWDMQTVRGIHRGEIARRGRQSELGRREQINERQGRKVLAIVEAQGGYAAAARWMNAKGMKTHRDTPWKPQDVRYAAVKFAAAQTPAPGSAA